MKVQAQLNSLHGPEWYDVDEVIRYKRFGVRHTYAFQVMQGGRRRVIDGAYLRVVEDAVPSHHCTFKCFQELTD